MIRLFAIIAVLFACTGPSVTAQSDGARLVDSFGRLPCGHMMGRLDSLVAEWLRHPESRIVVVYRGQRYRKTIGRGRDGSEVQILHRVHRDDGLNWAKGIPKYLLDQLAERGDLDKLATLRERVTLVDGGYDEEIRADLWLVPQGSSLPPVVVRLTAEQIKFSARRRYRIPNYVGCYSMYN